MVDGQWLTELPFVVITGSLVNASACTGLVHESFKKDDYSDFTRPWFAWANSYFAVKKSPKSSTLPQVTKNLRVFTRH